jgi:hypothetical protein
MKRAIYILALGVLLPALGFSASLFKVYPGAKLEDVYEPKQTEMEAKVAKAAKVIIFTTSAPFETVVAFYSGEAKEYKIPGSTGHPTKLPSGQELKEAYFIFDNAADIMTSKHWIKIQRPYLSRTQTNQGLQGRYQGVREVTAIIEEDKRSYKD